MAETRYDYYDDFVEGHAYEPFRTRLTADDAATLARCLTLGPLTGPNGELIAPANDAGDGAALSPFLLNSFHAMRARIRMPDGLLHARETMRLLAPAHAGDELETTIRIASKFLKNDRKFVLLEHIVRRPADGTHIMTFERLVAWVN